MPKNPDDINYMHPALLGAVQPNFELLVDTLHRSEGGKKASVPYGVLGVPVKDESEARSVALNTVRNQYKRWQDAGQPGTFLESLVTRYVDKKKDPQGWKNAMVNVPLIYAQMEKQLMESQGQPAMPGFQAPPPSDYIKRVLPNYKVE